MPFVEDPVRLSKSRLKSDLVAHNVELPPAASKKQVYVELHLKHVDQKHAADFSSDEDEHEQNGKDKNEDAEEIDPSSLTDDDLKAALLQHGVKAGPIVASTRALYEKKLRNLLQSDGLKEEKAVLYSDSEEEEVEVENGDEEGEDSGSEQEEAVENPDQATLECTEVESNDQDRTFIYPRCFSQSSKLRAPPFKNGGSCSKRNSRNVIKSSKQSRSHCSQIPVGISRTSSKDQRSGLGSGMETRSSPSYNTEPGRGLNGSNVQENWSRSNRPENPSVDKCKKRNQSLYFTPKSSPLESRKKLPQEPVKEILKEIFPDTQTTPTGIYVTCRRPIKGAAQRPVQYAYPETPVSPTTLHNQEVERRLVPLHIRIVVFLLLACVLYLIYLCVEDRGSVLDALDSLSLGSESSEQGQELPSDT